MVGRVLWRASLFAYPWGSNGKYTPPFRTQRSCLERLFYFALNAEMKCRYTKVVRFIGGRFILSSEGIKGLFPLLITGGKLWDSIITAFLRIPVR